MYRFPIDVSRQFVNPPFAEWASFFLPTKYLGHVWSFTVFNNWLSRQITKVSQLWTDANLLKSTSTITRHNPRSPFNTQSEFALIYSSSKQSYTAILHQESTLNPDQFLTLPCEVSSYVVTHQNHQFKELPQIKKITCQFPRKPQHELVIVQIKSDGSCLFNAIAVKLALLNQKNPRIPLFTALELRQKSTQLLRQKWQNSQQENSDEKISLETSLRESIREHNEKIQELIQLKKKEINENNAISYDTLERLKEELNRLEETVLIGTPDEQLEHYFTLAEQKNDFFCGYPHMGSIKTFLEDRVPIEFVCNYDVPETLPNCESGIVLSYINGDHFDLILSLSKRS